MKKNQNISTPKIDFRKRFAQRDLEISRNEYEYLTDRYLESKRAQEENISDKAKTKPLTELKQLHNIDVNIPSLKDTESSFVSTSDLYKKPEGKKAGAPEETKERQLDIQLPTIQNLVDEYSKPYVYNKQSGKFEQIKLTDEHIQQIRQDIQNRPTPLGISEYEEAYMRATDPVRLLKDLKTKYVIEDDKEEDVKEGWDTFAKIASAPLKLAGDPAYNAMKGAINRTIQKNKDYLDDILSTWNISKNDVETDAYVDAGIRLGEKQWYSNAIARYNNNIKNYIQLQQAYSQSKDNKEKHNLLILMNNILAQNDKMRTAVEQAVTYNYDESLGKSVTRGIAEFVNNALNNSFVNAILPPTALVRAASDKAWNYMLGDDIGRYGQRLLDLLYSSPLKPGQPIPDTFMNDYGEISLNIDKYNKSFQEASNKRIAEDKEMALRNKRESMEWAAWHTPSKEFKAKEKAAQNNYLTDAGTYTHGMWTVLGSSASFNGVQLLSTGLDWLGAGLLMAPHPVAKGAGAVATIAGGGLGMLSGVYENKAEITLNYINGLRQELDEKGKLKSFLDEGRKQLEELNIPVRDEQDIFRHFILKDYKSNDPVVRWVALKHLFGANNAFQNDMMAVSSDVAINAGINVFGSIGKVAESMKILPEGSKFAFLRKVAEKPMAKAIYQNASANPIMSAISPLANIPYNVVKPMFKGAKTAVSSMVKQMSRHIDGLASWAKVAPKTIFNVGTSKKYLFDFLGKTAVRGFSEAIEEGKQYEYGQMFANGEFAGKSNSIMSTLIDDLSTGLYTGLAFIGNQFFGMQADKELMANMRGGFIGGVLNHGTAITAVQDFANARGEIKAGDVIFNNVMAEKLRQRSNLINGEEMVKYATRSGYVAMMNAFDRMQRIQDRITADASDKIGLTKEELSDQRNMFRRIATLANDEHIINRAKKLGIKQNSDDFRKFVSLINTADQIQMENIRDYNQMVDLAKEILAEDGLSLDVVGLFNLARAAAVTDEQIELLNKAEEWAKWAQPLNNQILGQYAALNALIEDLEGRSEFLTTAERRNLDHYYAQRNKLDDIVIDIRSKIGSTENMDFLNQTDPELLTKYTQLYRTLYQASAQLETSTKVLDNLYGKNNASEAANDFVREQLDFINNRIDEENRNKSKAIKSSKKSKRDAAAIAIIEQYKKSVQDDQEFLAQLADMFDQQSYDSNNRLDAAYEEKALEEYEKNNPIQPVVEEEPKSEVAPEQPQQPLQPEQQVQIENQGAQNLPVSIYDKIPEEGKQFKIGDILESEGLPGTKFTVQSVKVNPTTGQYLLETTTEDGDVRYIDDKDIASYLKELPAPYNYETVLEDPDSWVKFSEKSPLAQSYRKASIKNLPAVIDKKFQDGIQDYTQEPLNWDPYGEDPQEMSIEHLAQLTQLSVHPVTWHPLYGAVFESHEDKYIYVQSFKDHVQEIYPEYDSEKKARLEIVQKLIEYRDAGSIDEIKYILEQYNISPAYINVLDDVAALNSIARQIIGSKSVHLQEWLQKLAFYTDPKLLENSAIRWYTPKGSILYSNVPFSCSDSYAYGDIVAVDKNGRYSVYILAFPDSAWSDEDLDSLSNGQKTTRRQYYENLANGLYRQMDPVVQQMLNGIYVMPITNVVHKPIALYVKTELSGFEGEVIQREIIRDFYNELERQVNDFLNKPVNRRRQKAQPAEDGSQETHVANITNDIEQLEHTISGVNNGTLSFNGKIRVDARKFIEDMRPVLNKHRNALKLMDQIDEVKSLISRIEQAYQHSLQILSAFREDATYADTDMQYSGETVKNNIAFIPDNHPLCSRSTSGIPVTATSDFIVNSKVELQYGQLNSNGEIVPLGYYTTYPGAGVYATFTYNGVKYKPVLITPSHYKNGVQPYTQEGAQFIMDVIALQNQAQGLPVVAEAVRMIPNPIYKGQPRPILSIPALHMTEDDIQELTGESDAVGMADVNNNVRLIDNKNDKSFLWKFKSTQAGSFFLMHTFKFAEYPDGGIIPVKLIPAKLKGSDIDVIVSILKDNLLNIATNGTSRLNSKYKVNGKETPLTNIQVLNLLIKIDLVQQRDSIFWIDALGMVYHKDYNLPIDINTQQGENIIRQMLSNGYELAQDKNVLMSNLGNPTDKLFGGLLKWIQENGNLVISDNIVFDLDDVARNGKGFHGIGWSIRHGRLLSNMQSIYDPSISISLPKIDNNVAQPEVEQPAAEEPTTHKRITSRYVPEEGGLLDGAFNVGNLFESSEEIPEEPLNEELAKEDIRRMLGDAAVEFVDEILGILKGGLKVLGVTMDNIIRISRLAGEGTQFHEAFHRIVELLFDDATRERLYNAFVRTHKDVDSTNPRAITEGLSEEFKEYARTEKAGIFTKYFARIKRFIKALVNKDRRILYKVYKNAFNGKYSNLKPSQENIDRFNRIFAVEKEERGVLYHSIYDSITGERMDLPNVPSAVDYRIAIDTIVDNIISEQGADVFGSSVTKLQLTKDDVSTLGIFKSISAKENKDDIDKMFEDILNHWDNVMGDVAASMKRFGLHFKYSSKDKSLETYKTNLSEEEQNAVDSADEDNAKTADINQYELQDYEISKLSKMSERTKYFFATIPDVRFATEEDGVDMYIPETNAQGEPIDVKGRIIKTDPETGVTYVEMEDGSILTGDNIKVNLQRNIVPNLNDFGFKQFAPFFATCNIALNHCYDVDSLSELLQSFRDLADEYPQFAVIAYRYASLLDNMKLRDKNGYYVTTDGQRYSKMDNGLFRQVIKDGFGEEWYTADELDFVVNNNVQSMAVSIFNNISGVRLNFKNIRSTRPSKEAIIFQVANTDNGYSSRRYMQQWHSIFLSDNTKVQPVEIQKDGEQVFKYVLKNKDLFKNAAADLRKIVEAYTDRRSEGYRTGEVKIQGKVVQINKNPEKLKTEYLRILNSVGIQVTREQFDHLLYKEFGKTDANALRKYFQQNGEDFGMSKGVSISKLILAMEQGADSNGNLSRTVVSGSFFSRVGALILLADGIWSYNQSQTELMQIAPGKNKYYAVANRNAQDLMIQALNIPNGKMANDLMQASYHAASILLPRLLSGEVYLKSCTNAGYESDNKSDFGSDFMQITNSEDVVSKITWLLDNYIVPPTLSNKKTYQPIQVFDSKTQQPVPLPGTKYIANKQNTQTDNSTAEVYNATDIPVLVDKTYGGKFITPSGKMTQQRVDRMEKHFVVSDDVYDALINYAFSEYYSVLEGLKRQDTIADSEKVVNFDTAEKGAPYPGNVRFSRFYTLYVPRELNGSIVYDEINLNDFSNGRTPKDNLRDAEMYFFGDHVSRDQRISILNEILERTFDDNLEYFRKVGIIRYRSGWRNLPKYNRYEPVTIDTAHLNAIIKAYGNSLAIEGNISARSIATCAFLFDVCIKHQIAMEEYQRLFAGNPALFVSFFDNGKVTDDTQDLSKRLGGHVSTGETQCALDDVPSVYNQAELRDYKISSEQKDELENWFDESESRFILYSEAQKAISIRIQNINQRLQAICPAIRGKGYDSDYLLETFASSFEDIDDAHRQRFAELMESISRTTDKSAYNGLLKELYYLIKSYKSDLVKAEYKRQEALSLDEAKEELNNKKLLTGVETRVAAYSGSYNSGKINVADGASFISPLMVKWMLKSIGKFNGKVAKAWESLLSDDVRSPLQNAIDYKLITDALFGTQKYTATGYRMNNGYPIFSYLKTALFALFKQIGYGRTGDILALMEKDNVHLLAFESAMKFGSQGKQHFPETAELLSTFRFNTYPMEFKWLRKLLNTDPKESELMAVGTQTKKIALTILDIYKDDYVARNGEIETGLDIRNRIFEADRQLAILGWRDIVKRFNSEEEIAKYIRDNLAERDADADTLQGLGLQRGEDGKLEMVSPLEGLSNGEWIQSIITSLANKHIVDVNLPGSAFIQRSVYMMENGSILGDDQIPSIPKLKISNDWSTMDAVVSIDYFYQQFSFLEKMSFDDARDWLIKHNLIGENAIADTVAYRIPTQANSSIHALRFVDVISTVRDTIILPSEFTAITGSDFDIDKLFLSTKYFHLNDDDIVTTEFDLNSNPKEFYGNQLMECYLELLSQSKSKYANQLVRSIDYDIEIPMKVVNLLKQGQVKPIGTYEALQLYRQCQIKSENRTGGIGVGPYALNNNSQIMSMLFEVESYNRGIVKALDISRLYDKLDAEGDSVMATIGAFISGHVDIAKNPWVTILNINEYTYDIHLYLARAGMGLRALWFCSQPIMRKVADIYIQAGGYLFDSNNEGAWIRRRKAFNQFEKEVFVDGNSFYQTLIKQIREYGNQTIPANSSKQRKQVQVSIDSALRIILQIFGVNPENPSEKVNVFRTNTGKELKGTILQDIALHHNTEEDIYDPTPRYTVSAPVLQEDGSVLNQDIQVSVKDVQFYVYLANIMLDDPVSDMKKLVQLAKIETKKQGKNRAELLAYNMNYESFFKGNGPKIMIPYTLEDMVNGSAINTKQRLFMDSMNYMLNRQLLAYTPAYETFIQQFINYGSLRRDAKTIKSIINGISGWLKYQFIKDYAKQHDIDLRSLFVGNDSIYNELGRIKGKIIESPAVYDRYTDGNGRITNALIAKLQPSDIPSYVQEEYGDTLPKFVDFQSNQGDTSAVSTDMKAGWMQMLTDTEHPDIQQFARRLVVYAFMTSGDTNTFGSFFNKVPMYWRNEDSMNEVGDTYIDRMRTLLNRFSNREEGMDEDGEWAIDDFIENKDIFVQILKNNWFDENLVPTIQETSRDEFGNVVSNYFEYVQDGSPILVALIKSYTDENGVVHFKEPSVQSPKSVIKIHKHDHDSYRNPQDFRLYQLVRMATVKNEAGDLISFPVYGRTAPTGGVMYGHTIIQYGDDLNFGWEHDTLEYNKELDAKFKEGMYQLYEWFDLQMSKNEDAVTKGLVSYAELKENTVKDLPDTSIKASFEDGTPIELTASNSFKFYNMVKMMGQYLMLHPSNDVKKDYHTDALSNLKKPKAATKDAVIAVWNNIKLSEKTESHGVHLSTSPSSLITEYKQWLFDNKDGIVAYRVDRNNFNTADAVANNIIGNPFDFLKYGTQNAVDMFFNWIVNNNNYGEPLATDEFRNAIIQKINDTKVPNILYYKELGYHSHATALGYIIENKDALFGITKQEVKEENKTIDVYSTNRDRYSNLSNVAIRPMQVTPSILNLNQDILNRVVKKMDKNEFKSVEQLFQLIKFEMMRDHVREKAKELYGLERLQIQSSDSREAMAIKQILENISKKEDRIRESSGSSVTQISHEPIPDINDIISSFWKEKWNEGGPENYKNSTSYNIIREIMLQSFLLNPGAARLLLSTENATITHNRGSIYWKEAFPDALMSVRDEIKENYDNLVELENKGITILGGNQFAYEEYSIPIKHAKEGKMFSDVEPFFTEEEAAQIKASIPEGTHLTVASASRHTDPVFYASKIIDMLRENSAKPFTDPTRINVMEIWSKHDGIPMQNILEACKKYRVAPMVQFSITGLGNSVIEPGVMKYADLLDNIEKLVEQGILDPRVTSIRIDPILPGVSSVEDLRAIIERAVKMGVRKFITSPMQTYSTQKDRQGRSRSVIPHIDAALKSDPSSPIKYKDVVLPDGSYDWMKVYGLHPNQKINPGAIAFIPKKDYMKPYVELFEEMMAKYEITIQSCAVAVGNLKPSACLDPDIIEAVTSLSVDSIEDKSRPFCACYGAHSDLFRMTDECNSSCTYCYQGWAKASPFDYYDENGKLKDFAYAKVNEYGMPEEGPAEVVIKDNKYVYNEGSVVDSQGNEVDDATKQRVIWKRAVDLGKAHLVNVNGIYYVVTNTGLIFNWGTAKVEQFSQYDKVKKLILDNLQDSSYNKPNVSTLFNASELKQLGESRKKFCKRH